MYTTNSLANAPRGLSRHGGIIRKKQLEMAGKIKHNIPYVMHIASQDDGDKICNIFYIFNSSLCKMRSDENAFLHSLQCWPAQAIGLIGPTGSLAGYLWVRADHEVVEVAEATDH